jgi:hypothetical protein
MSRIQSLRLGLQVAHFLSLANQPRVPFNEPNAQCRSSAENVHNICGKLFGIARAFVTQIAARQAAS